MDDKGIIALFHYEMEGDFEMVYTMHVNGEPKAFTLLHLPSGDTVDVSTGDVRHFIEEHS